MLKTAVAHRLTLWALHVEVPGSIHGRISLGNEFVQIVLIWVFWVLPQSSLLRFA